jgi:hypothetical protein
MDPAPRLTVEDCWADGGRLRLEVSPEGTRARLRGNADGFVGLARILLYLAHYGPAGSVVPLGPLGAFAEGGPQLELEAPKGSASTPPKR